MKKAGAYAKRVDAAQRLWDAKANTKANRAAFDEVKRLLEAACSGRRRCAYCEDSLADEIEHIWPKSLYPELAFAWANYLYACGPCNVAKGGGFAVFVNQLVTPTSVARAPNAPVRKPIAGSPVFLDPRVDDPLQFLVVDVGSAFPTGRLLPRPGLTPKDDARAQYTIARLGLNQREALLQTRLDVFRIALMALHHAAAAHAGTPQSPPAGALASAKAVITHTPHRFVWEFMKRERAVLPAVNQLLNQVPQALLW